MEFLAWALASTPFVDRTIGYLSKRSCTARGYPYMWMVPHIFSATTLILRYYLMNKVDFPVAATFVLSAAALQYHREKIQPPVYRAVFRASILLQTAVFILAFTGRPDLRDSGVRFLWWFTTTRLGGKFMTFVPTATKTLTHSGDLIVLGSVMVAVWYANLSVGLHMLLVMTFLWTDQKLLGPKNEKTDEGLVES